MSEIAQASMLCLLGRDDEIDAGASACASPAAQAGFWTAVAENLHEQGRYAAAIRAATRGVDADPRSVKARVAFILAALADGRPNRAAQEAETLLRAAPDDADALRAAALAALGVGRVETAETLCAAAGRKAPERADVRAAAALIYMLCGKRAEAASAFAAALAAAPDSAEAAGNYAALLAAEGRDQDAQRQARRAIALKPFMPAPYAVIGRLLGRNGEAAQATLWLRRAVLAGPGRADVLLDFADALRRSGRPSDAAAVCRAGLALTPDSAGLWTNLGVARHAGTDEPGALAAYSRALTATPDLPEAINNLARLHQECGRLREAAALLRQACAQRPDDETLRRNLTAVLIDAGLLQEAAPLAAAAVQKAPDDPDALLRLGQLLCLLDRFDEAEAAFRQALRRQDAPVEAGLLAGRRLLDRGQASRALAYARWAIRRAPRDGRGWSLFAHALRACPVPPDDPALVDELIEAFSQPGAEPSHLTFPAARLALRNPGLSWLAEISRTVNGPAAAAAALQEGELDGLAQDPLIAAVLDHAPATDCDVEKALTLLRRALLAAAAARPLALPAAPQWIGFAARLARQCFLNEYVYEETAEEGVAVASLGRKLADELVAGQPPHPLRLAVYAAYRPLDRWPAADRLAAAAWPAEITRLLQLQVIEPNNEALLRKEIPQLTEIDDPVSRQVRSQYEANPYPRWRAAALFDQPLPAGRVLRALLPHAELPPTDWSAPEILVAGCGTGRETVWVATQFTNANVLGIDLSLSSLAYARRQSDDLGLRNITYAQADILRLDEIPARRFDMIHCVGVLHHTGDPDAGLAALVRRLKPDGVMKLGYYSKAARRAVTAAHALIAQRQWPDPTTEMHALRRALRALPADHPAAACARSPDFFSTSACRDLLYHVHERNVSLPELHASMNRRGLRLLGFQVDDPAVAARYRARFPEDPGMRRWDLWERFETDHPDTFAGLYQFWVAHQL